MAEFHNFSDLKVQFLLERELRDVRNELRQAAGYDPTMSLAENVKMFIDCARLLGDLHKSLRKQFNDLKEVYENDKEVARSYPLAGDSGFAALSSPKQSGPSLGSVPMEFQPPIPSNPIAPVANSCPKTCSDRLTATDARIEALQAQVDQLREAMNHDIPILNDRTLDLNERLKKLEGKAGWDRAYAELNDLDARVAQLERPEPEDEAK